MSDTAPGPCHVAERGTIDQLLGAVTVSYAASPDAGSVGTAAARTDCLWVPKAPDGSNVTIFSASFPRAEAARQRFVDLRRATREAMATVSGYTHAYDLAAADDCFAQGFPAAGIYPNDRLGPAYSVSCLHGPELVEIDLQLTGVPTTDDRSGEFFAWTARVLTERWS